MRKHNLNYIFGHRGPQRKKENHRGFLMVTLWFSKKLCGSLWPELFNKSEISQTTIFKNEYQL